MIASFAERAAPYIDGSAFGRPVAILPLWWAIDGACACPAGVGCSQKPAKHPASTHGLKDATTDPAAVAEWSSKWPAANIGLALAANGLCALDVDGERGRESLREHPESIPLTTLTTTGRGGHLIYATPDGRRGRGTPRVVPGLDLRGPNYLVAPGSVHVSGTPYEWDVPPWRVAPQPAPDWMLVPLEEPAPVGRVPVAAVALDGATGTAYGVAALRALLEALAATGKGERHARVYWTARRAGELVAGGHLDRDDATWRIAQAAAVAFAGENAEKEIASAIADGLAKAAA